jgi:hypothetical protein
MPMMKLTRNSPRILRLIRIEERFKNRYERALVEADQATAYRAMERYVAVAARADAMSFGVVSQYSERN